jgi:hypothetical protein
MFGRSRAARGPQPIRCLLAANHICRQLATMGKENGVRQVHLNSTEVSQLKVEILWEKRKERKRKKIYQM